MSPGWLSDKGCELAEWHQVAEDAHWSGERGQLLHLTFRAWLSLMEQEGRVVQAVPYRRLAVCSGRTLSKVHQYMSELVKLGWLNQLEPGHYQRWDEEDEDRKAAVWGTASLSEHPIGVTRIEQRLAQARWTYIEQQHAVISSWGADRVDVLREDGFIEPYRGPSFDDYLPPRVIPPGLLTGGTPSGSCPCSCGLPQPYEGRSNTENHVLATDSGCYPSDTERDDGHVGVLAPSPLDYLTWADAWQQSQAGVLGWALARQQVRWPLFPSTRVRAKLALRLPLSTVTPSEAGRLVGIEPQNGSRLLRRLAERGFAEKVGSFYRLLFDEAFNDGRLSSGVHQSAAQAVESRRQENQAIRADGFKARRRLRGDDPDHATLEGREHAERPPAGRPQFRTTTRATRDALAAVSAGARTYLVLLLHPWVLAVLVRECTPPDS